MPKSVLPEVCKPAITAVSSDTPCSFTTVETSKLAETEDNQPGKSVKAMGPLEETRNMPARTEFNPTDYAVKPPAEVPLRHFANDVARSASESAKKNDKTVLKKTLAFTLAALAVVAVGCTLLFAPHSDKQSEPVLLSTDAAELATVDKLIEGKDFQKAIPLLDKMLERDPQLNEAFQERGRAYLGLHMYRQAADDFSTALSVNPRLTKSLLDRAACFYYLAEYDKAQNDYDDILAGAPENAAALLGRGMCKDKLNNSKDAVTDLETAVKIKPKYAEAYDELGTAYLAENEIQKSLDAYAKSIEINPKSAQTFFNRGNVYCKDNQKARAIADYTMAISLEPNRPEFLNNRGYIFLQDGSFEKAIADFTAAVLLDPNYERAKQNLVLARSHTRAVKP
ncbi:MAG: tetratricopeptide repeat protein [Candidatus Obscuribacterales bacterium]|nr:tetratricopeptide repeat protein [Candidatus Obscuribacterales bacterium]